MKCLGIDPALRNIGVVLTDYDELKNKHKILDAATFKTKARNKKKSKFSDGEHDFYASAAQFKALKEYIEEHDPDFIAIEIGSGSRGYRGAMGLACMKGFMGSLYICFPKKKWILVTPAEAKEIIVDYADKTLIKAYVRKKYKDYPWSRVDNQFEHQSDAVVILESALLKV